MEILKEKRKTSSHSIKPSIERKAREKASKKGKTYSQVIEEKLIEFIDEKDNESVEEKGNFADYIDNNTFDIAHPRRDFKKELKELYAKNNARR